MKLYHGTSETALDRIREHGITPRGFDGRKSHWQHASSNRRTVYLTDAYPLYFGLHASGREGGRAVVLELDTDALDESLFVPDEDVLEQARRGRDDVVGSMRMRTYAYRRRLSE